MSQISFFPSDPMGFKSAAEQSYKVAYPVRFSSLLLELIVSKNPLLPSEFGTKLAKTYDITILLLACILCSVMSSSLLPPSASDLIGTSPKNREAVDYMAYQTSSMLPMVWELPISSAMLQAMFWASEEEDWVLRCAVCATKPIISRASAGIFPQILSKSDRMTS